MVVARRACRDRSSGHSCALGENLRRLLRQQKFKVTIDQDFAGVIEACAQPRTGKVPLTWITPRVMQAYYAAHQAGYAHSVEVWDQQGRLVGGLYGMAIGKVFFGESQFSYAEHSWKVALVALHRHLAAWQVHHLRDGKVMTDHLRKLRLQEPAAPGIPGAVAEACQRARPRRALERRSEPRSRRLAEPQQAAQTAQPVRQATA